MQQEPSNTGFYFMTLTAAVPCQPTGCEAAAAAEQQLKELVID